MNQSIKILQSNLEKRLSEYVSARTVTSNTPACRKFITGLAAECTRRGMYTYVENGLHPALVATSQPNKNPKIMLVMHCDVVPSTDETLFKMRTSKNKIFGRGVYDMKFAIACAMEFIEVHTHILRTLDIGIMITSDEEQGGYEGTRKLLQSGWQADVAIVPDGGENWRLETRAKGLKQYRIISKGESAHASRPWEGDNAIERITKALVEIQSAYGANPRSGLTMSVNKIIGGNAVNQLPEFAEAYIDFRSYDKSDFIAVYKKLSDLAVRLDLTVAEISSGNPIEIDKSNYLVKEFAKSFHMVRGKKMQYCESYGATDSRWFAELNIPSIVIRPRGGSIHSSKEWVHRGDLTAFYELIEHYLLTTGKNVTTSTTLHVEKLVDSLVNR